jgi:hypothetical protein
LLCECDECREQFTPAEAAAAFDAQADLWRAIAAWVGRGPAAG